jgi:Mrp family chromosome partitioning ATPase
MKTKKNNNGIFLCSEKTDAHKSLVYQAAISASEMGKKTLVILCNGR